MVDLMTLWKEHVFINDPRVRQVTTRFLSAMALVVLVGALVNGFVGQDGELGTDEALEPAALPQDPAAATCPAEQEEGNTTGAEASCPEGNGTASGG